MLKTQSGKRQREKLKTARATARSVRGAAAESDVVDGPAHDFRIRGAVGQGTLLETVFHVREAAYEVEKRVAAARLPLQPASVETDPDTYYGEVVPIPQRPAWDPKQTAAQVQTAEDEAFEAYLQGVYDKYPPTRLNHFEHNVHVWRQLWRAVEMSDMLMVVADARCPAFHMPPSLYDYVVHQAKKPLLCVLNKIDFISAESLERWLQYFARRFPLLTVVPFSCFPHDRTVTNPEAGQPQDRKRRAVQHERNAAGGKGKPPPFGVENLLRVLDEIRARKEQRETEAAAADGTSAAGAVPARRGKSKAALFAKQRENEHAAALERVRNTDLMADLKSAQCTTSVSESAATAAVPAVAEDAEQDEDPSEEHAAPSSAPAAVSHLTVAAVGHPNVGKSSVINALFGRTVVSASETPGHTKHCQSLPLTAQLTIVDCPGLVFAAVDMPRALQVLGGIFPIEKLREPYSSLAYLAARIDVPKIYGLTPPTAAPAAAQRATASTRRRHAAEDDDEEGSDMFSALQLQEAAASAANYTWSVWDIAEAFAKSRGYTVKGSLGLYDCQRAASEILHDALSGVILLTFEPPSTVVSQSAASAAAAAASQH